MIATDQLLNRINRLLDIVVEEVSLVDRAANRRRFLIVKRSDYMDENMSSPEDQPVDLNADTGTDPSSGWDDFEDRTVTDTESTPHGRALAIAVRALEQLTQAVELLAADDQAESARLADLAVQLHEAADQLATMAGGDHTTDASSDAAVSALLGAVATTLQHAKGIAISSPGRNRGAPNAVPAPAPTPASPEPSAALEKQLVTLTDTMRSLNTTLAQQQQRLARLEKQHGLPNSRPPGERPTRHEEDNAGWPLDLNKPFDRTSVDKAVSFHDA